MQNFKNYTDYMTSPLGVIKIEASKYGITGIEFTSQKKVPSLGCRITEHCIIELAEYFSGRRKIFSLPLDYKGTDFQNSIWSALQDIVFSETISYGTVARMAGKPAAIRAAGTALKKNPIAIIVPCHRVIGKNGALTGYSGGLERKSWLLAHENYYKSQLSLGNS
ncbi:MAG: methylated-DNA-[protein]-cysteine S-methyltransferase [Porticoccus sp.]|jgi:methylated-DNA-[protein]-cysteine S-methyltransferase